MPTESLFVKIGADLTEFTGAMDKVSKRLERFGSNVTRLGTSLSLRVTAPILALGGAVIKLGMDSVESENLFKESMGSMADRARAWSEQLSSSLGLNAYKLRENVALFYEMLQRMTPTTEAAYDMSTGLVKLAYDMASFYNLKPHEAFDKLRAGITGEIEPLKRLGIVVDEETVKVYAYANGIAEIGEKLTQQQKVQARYLAIMDQTAKAQGDLDRTLDSPLNKLRRFGERMTQIGQKLGAMVTQSEGFNKLLERMDGLIEKTERLAMWFMKLSPEVQTNILTFIALAAAIGPVLVAFGLALNGLGGIVAAISATVGGIGTLIGALGALTLPVTAVIAVFGTLAYMWIKNVGGMQQGWKIFVGYIREYGVVLQELLGRIVGQAIVLIGTLWKILTHPWDAKDIWAGYVAGFKDNVAAVTGAWQTANANMEKVKAEADAEYRASELAKIDITKDATSQIAQIHKDKGQQTIDAKREQANAEAAIERQKLENKLKDLEDALRTEQESIEKSYAERLALLKAAEEAGIESIIPYAEMYKRIEEEKTDFYRRQEEERKEILQDALEQMRQLHYDYLTGRQELEEYYRTGDVESFMEHLTAQRALYEQDLYERQALMDTYAELMATSQMGISEALNRLAQAAYQGISKNLSALIMGAKSARDALKAMGQAMVQAIVDFVVQKIVAHTIGKALMAVTQALSIGMARALAAAWEEAAVWVSLATFGANAAPAMAGIGAAFAFAATMGNIAGVPGAKEGAIISGPGIMYVGEGAEPEMILPLSRADDFGFGRGGANVTIENIEIWTAARDPEEIADSLAPVLQDRLEAALRSE